ncbi:hypothetical protein [Sphingomonas sanxanigenens]|uniref:hypothetical protein n=1 Tax=Sphingomonas sanxanigenens TaxID=397260 RepID=UPI0013012374|nr:hypothetical protein [Sphingomonas sanxanigenens]
MTESLRSVALRQKNAPAGKICTIHLCARIACMSACGRGVDRQYVCCRLKGLSNSGQTLWLEGQRE